MDNSLEHDYEIVKPIYEKFIHKLKELLLALMESEQIDYHLIEDRVKSIESIKDKLLRNEGKYKNPLVDLSDLCGIRIIVYYQDDIDKVEKLIKDNFEIIIEESRHQKEKLKSNEFGYLSIHYVIKINKKRSVLAEWKAFKDIQFELQIRTVLQHSWAAISHKLQYKKKYDIPSTLKRKLYRLAGLIELADEEFLDLRIEHLKLEEKINKDTQKVEEVSNEINILTLSKFFEEEESYMKELGVELSKIGYHVGRN